MGVKVAFLEDEQEKQKHGEGPAGSGLHSKERGTNRFQFSVCAAGSRWKGRAPRREAGRRRGTDVAVLAASRPATHL